MKMKYKICFLCLALLQWSIGRGQEDIRQKFLEELIAKGTKVETISSEFVQVKHNSMLANDVKSRGEFRFHRPCRLALIYDEPKGDRVVMGESDFLIVAGGTHSVVKIPSNPLFAQMQEVFAACFSGDIGALTSDGMFRCEQTPEGYTVRITPESKRARRYISELILKFNARDMLLDELRIMERSGNYSSYLFQKRKINLPIDEQSFSCEE